MENIGMKYNNPLFDLPVIVNESKRRVRTIKITVKHDGILLTVPLQTSKKDIDRVLKEKQNWINHTLKHLKHDVAWHDRQFYLLGEPISVQLHLPHGKHWYLRESDGTLQIYGPSTAPDSEAAKSMLEQWYKQKALTVISRRTDNWAKALHLSYHKLRIKDQKSRWGSCSAKGNLNFNWRLIQAPSAIVDYVIVHELCHLKEMNHSAKFWTHVEAALPDYRQAKLWLRNHGSQLYF